MIKLKKQRGFSLITAIFLIVVLAGLITFMIINSSIGQLTPQLAYTQARTYQAARAGLEYGIYDAIKNAGANCSGGTTVSTGTAAFSGITISVSCSSSTHDDGQPAQTVTIYEVTATATSGTAGGLSYAVRTLRAEVSPSGPL